MRTYELVDEKLHLKKVLIAGFWYLVIATILQQVEVAFTMSYYKDPQLFGLWSKLMMPARIASQSVAGGPGGGPPPAAFFITSLLFTFATGCTLAAVFEFMSELFGKGFWRKVIGFTDIMVGLMIVFGYFPMYLLFNVPPALMAWWLGTSWVTMLAASAMFAKVMQ